LSRESPARTLVALTAVYFLAGKLGLKLAFVHGSATAVWPPTGIALAALLLLGRWAWPAIFVGAFLVNVTTTGAFLSSVGIAMGNTLEALLGATLVERYAGGQRALDRPRNVFRFAILAGMVSTAVSASFGVASLALDGAIPRGQWASVWLTWWLGDVGGDLVVAPPLLLWGGSTLPKWPLGRIVEALLIVVAVIVAGVAVFAGFLPGAWNYPASFLCLPLLLWAAFRLGRRVAATVTAIFAAIAIWGAVAGVGPFVRPSPNESLLLLLAFMSVISVSTLAMAAAIAERRQVEQALARTAAIVNSSDDAILGKTLDGTIVSWNPGAERLYGYRTSEMLGRNVATLTAPGRPNEIPSIMERIRRGESVEHYETLRTRKDGRVLAVSLSVSPIRDEAGKVVGASSIARDITERKRGEQRLAIQSAVTRLFTESSTLRDAAPGLLRIGCKELGWDLGELWLADQEEDVLRCVDRWPPSSTMEGKDDTLGSGSDLPGRVWESARNVWIDDLTVDRRLARDCAAARAGMRSALAGPIWAEGGIVGVLAFYGNETRPRDTAQLDTMVDLNSRIGLFLDRVRAFEAMRRLQQAVETMDLGVTITDLKGRILYTNPAEAALHGYEVDEIVGRHVSLFMPASQQRSSAPPSELRSWRRETANVRKDGTIFPVQLLSDAVTDADGTPIGIVTVCEEISERKRAERALRASEERYRLLFERNLAGVFRSTLDGRILECNEAFARILGYATAEEVLSRSAWDLYFNRQDRQDGLVRLRERGALTNFELRMRRKDGSSIWVLQNASLLSAEDGQQLVEGTLIDITERKLAEQRIEFHAYHDALTQLPNRMHLRDRMQQALAHARRSGHGLTVVFLDLDHFKAVNDRLGHAIGDKLLQEVARRLRECVREDDTVARVGGDEFVLLLADVRDTEGAAHIARKLIARIEQPMQLDGHELTVTTSLGIALYPYDGKDAESLLKNADSALYRAKELGRGGYQLCDPAAERKALERVALQHQLRYALERDELDVVYQPQIDLGTGRIAEMEALLRWNHPQLGLISPTEFVPLAEDMGLITRLGEWVLRKACQRASAWKQRGLPPVRVAVNLSIRQFRQTDLRATVEKILRETGLSPRQLDLEITETTAMQNFDLTVPVLRHFATMGIMISIDDFGTGYSSLSRLQLLPVQRLKIDRSFIAGLGHKTQEAVIVKAIIRMAHSLGLAVVAEGVETEEQLSVLRRLRCDEIQGRVVSDAVPEEACGPLLAAAVRRYGQSA
jgi:diguanylate cyclase (GGDEF)-like protein/PAS domain S-box-containing protein